jgi:hypothetical protein
VRGKKRPYEKPRLKGVNMLEANAANPCCKVTVAGCKAATSKTIKGPSAKNIS